MCFVFSELGLDGLLESRIEIALIEALEMTKWCVDCYMNTMCHNLLKIFHYGCKKWLTIICL